MRRLGRLIRAFQRLHKTLTIDIWHSRYLKASECSVQLPERCVLYLHKLGFVPSRYLARLILQMALATLPYHVRESLAFYSRPAFASPGHNTYLYLWLPGGAWGCRCIQDSVCCLFTSFSKSEILMNSTVVPKCSSPKNVSCPFCAAAQVIISLLEYCRCNAPREYWVEFLSRSIHVMVGRP